MTKYSEGDIVVVRPDIKYGSTYYMDDMFTHDIATESMCEFAGTQVTIESVKHLTDGGYKYTIEEGDCWWTDDMFIREPDLEESDMPIENLLGIPCAR